MRSTHRAEAQTHARLRQSLVADLESLDAVFGYHEVAIDPQLIAPIHGHDEKAVFARGDMTRYIYECLKAAAGRACTAR
jgi:hypothetical protein